jgi:hypothetical protein
MNQFQFANCLRTDNDSLMTNPHRGNEMPTPFGAYLHVRSLLVLPGYRLRLAFDDGTERVIDTAPRECSRRIVFVPIVEVRMPHVLQGHGSAGSCAYA